MNISKVSAAPQYFTSNNNNKSNSAKWLGFGLSTGFIGAEIINAGGFNKFAQSFYKQVAKDVADEATQAWGGTFTPQNKLFTQKMKNIAHWNIFSTIATIVGCCVFVGAIFDSIFNATRRN